MKKVIECCYCGNITVAEDFECTYCDECVFCPESSYDDLEERKVNKNEKTDH